MGRFLRLTDPSHQRGQDLQVLSLLDVEEGERSKEEGEDSLGMKRAMRRCAEVTRSRLWGQQPGGLAKARSTTGNTRTS